MDPQQAAVSPWAVGLFVAGLLSLSFGVLAIVARLVPTWAPSDASSEPSSPPRVHLAPSTPYDAETRELAELEAAL
jgi:hypothetical protein